MACPSIALTTAGTTLAGVVTVDYSLQNIRSLMAGLELGATGYGFVFTAAAGISPIPSSA